jgi:hypothetical protein
MKWWIETGVIVSPALEIGKPDNWQEVEGVDGNLEDLYFDGNQVVAKPPQPSPDHYWNDAAQRWVIPGESEPLTLEDTINQQRQACLDYWNSKIAALTVNYPDPEVATWTELKAQATQFLATQNLTESLSLYHEIMLRQFGPEATPDYCEQFRQELPDEAVQLTAQFAQLILQKGAYLTSELIHLKGLRSYHWEQIGTLKDVEAVLSYDFSVEA